MNGRSNHVVATCCPFSVFSSGCQFESARCCVDDFGSCFVRAFTAMSNTMGLVTLCVVFFFQAQALRPERPKQHLVQSHAHQR